MLGEVFEFCVVLSQRGIYGGFEPGSQTLGGHRPSELAALLKALKSPPPPRRAWSSQQNARRALQLTFLRAPFVVWRLLVQAY